MKKHLRSFVFIQPIQILCDAATPSSSTVALPLDLQELDSSSHLHDHISIAYDCRNPALQTTVGAPGVFEPVRTPKALDTLSVSSLSSGAFSRSPSFKLSTSPNVFNDDATHQSIPNTMSTSNHNYLRLNSIPINSTSPLLNQGSDPQNRVPTSDASRYYLHAPNLFSFSPPILQPPSQKQKVTRHSSSDDAILLHHNMNEADTAIRHQLSMPSSRTVPIISSSQLQNVTADIGHSYGRQYSLNLQQIQNQHNLISNLADLNVNDSHDRSRTFLESGQKTAEQATSPRYNCVNSEDELTRSSSFRKSFHKKWFPVLPMSVAWLSSYSLLVVHIL